MADSTDLRDSSWLTSATEEWHELFALTLLGTVTFIFGNWSELAFDGVLSGAEAVGLVCLGIGTVVWIARLRPWWRFAYFATEVVDGQVVDVEVSKLLWFKRFRRVTVFFRFQADGHLQPTTGRQTFRLGGKDEPVLPMLVGREARVRYRLDDPSISRLDDLYI